VAFKDKPGWLVGHPNSKKELKMLVLSRQRDESIIIGDNIVITIVDIRGDKVRLGIQAPTDISVHRQEIYDAINNENAENTDNDSAQSEVTKS
jgi:carbon storage regulator